MTQTAPNFYRATAGQPEQADRDLVTLARMEIGGIRFVLPLADIAAVIEPTAMTPQSDDPYGIWIGHIRSHHGLIAVASGSALIRTGDRSIKPGRIAILRGKYPVGLAVDRMLSAEAVSRESLVPLPAAVPSILTTPVSATLWGVDDELELLLDREILIADLDADFIGPSGQRRDGRPGQQKLFGRYADVDYQRGLEVRFEASQERWMLPMSVVRLVTDSRKPHPLPGTPEKVAGLVSWQRQPIPVIDPSFDINLDRPVSLPARFIVVGEPAAAGQTSTHADAAIIVDGVAGIHHNLRIEHGYAWDVTGDAINILRLTDILS